MFVAAIQYQVDQNAPSYPFLLEIPCADDPTRDELEAAVTLVCQKMKDKIAAEYEGEYGEEYDDTDLVKVSWDESYGDLAVGYGEDNFWFIGLPDGLREKFGLVRPRW